MVIENKARNFRVARLNATSKGGVSKLVKAWEAKNAERSKRIAGLGLMAVSLAACGGSDDSDTPVTPVPTDGSVRLSDVAGKIFLESSARGITQASEGVASLYIANETADDVYNITFNATNVAGKVTFQFADANDVVVLNDGSDMGDVTNVEVINGTVDFTKLTDAAFNVEAISVKSGSILTADQLSELDEIIGTGEITVVVASDADLALVVANAGKFASSLTVSIEAISADVTAAEIAAAEDAIDAAKNNAPEMAEPTGLNRAGEEDKSITLTSNEILAQFSDADGDDLSIVSVKVGDTIVVADAQGNYVFVPEANEAGKMEVTVTVTDGIEAVTKLAVLTFAAVNDAPTFAEASTAVVVKENTTAVGTFAATDIDSPNLTYSLSGADAALFTIDAATGVASFKAAPNYEAGLTEFNIKVVASDGALTAEKAVKVTLENVAESSVFDLTSARDTFPGDELVDTFLANEETLGQGDKLDGKGGIDTLSLDIDGSSNEVDSFVATNIEIIDITMNAASANKVWFTGVDKDLVAGALAEIHVRDVEQGSLELRDIQTLEPVIHITDADQAVSVDYDDTLFKAASVEAVSVKISEMRVGSSLTVDAGVDTLNLTSVATAGTTANVLDSLTSGGVETLNIDGGADLTINAALNAGITTLNASTATGDLTLDVSASTTAITASTGLGDDVLATGDSIGKLDEQDTFDGNAGKDELTAVFTTAGTRNPISSEFETFTLTFNDDATLDFTDVDDVATINIKESAERVALIDMDNTVKTINVSGDQTGAWDIDYETDENADLTLNWANNTGAKVSITSLEFDEAQKLTINSTGSDDVDLGDVNFDVNNDDFSRQTLTDLTIRVSGNGDLSLYDLKERDSGESGSTDSVERLTLITEDGDLNIGADYVGGTEGEGIADLESLETLIISATEGDIKIGKDDRYNSLGYGSGGAAAALELVRMSTDDGVISMGNINATGATISTWTIDAGDDSTSDVTIGTITAQDIGEMTITIEQAATVTLGDIALTDQGDELVVSGEGKLGALTFTDEAFATMDFSGLVNNGVSVTALKSDGDVEIFATDLADTIDLTTSTNSSAGDFTIDAGKGADKVTLGAGIDTYVVNTGDTVLWTGVDKGTDGAGVVTFKNGADLILNFADEAAGEYNSNNHNDVIELNGKSFTAADFTKFGTLAVDDATGATVYTKSTIAGFENYYVMVGEWTAATASPAADAKFTEKTSSFTGNEPDFMFVHYDGTKVLDVLVFDNGVAF